LIFGPLLDFVCEGMLNGMGSAYMSPGGQRPALMPNGTPQGQRPPTMGQFQSPGGATMRHPYPGMTPISYGQTPTQGAQMPVLGAQMAPNLYPGGPMTPPGMHVNPQTSIVPHPPGNSVVD